MNMVQNSRDSEKLVEECKLDSGVTDVLKAAYEISLAVVPGKHSRHERSHVVIQA